MSKVFRMSKNFLYDSFSTSPQWTVNSLWMGSSRNESPTQTISLKMFSAPNYNRDLTNRMEKWQMNACRVTDSYTFWNELTDEANYFTVNCPPQKRKSLQGSAQTVLSGRRVLSALSFYKQLIGRGRSCATVAAVSGSACRCDLLSHRIHQVWDCEKTEMLKSHLYLPSLSMFIHSLPPFEFWSCLLLAKLEGTRLVRFEIRGQWRVWQDVTILVNLEGF